MSTVKYYHVTEKGLEEGEALGRISVVLKSDYEMEVERLQEERKDEFTHQRNLHIEAQDYAEKLQSELTKALELLEEVADEDGDKYVMGSSWHERLAHQSAPAAKSDKCSDGGTCGLGGFCTNCHNLA